MAFSGGVYTLPTPALVPGQTVSSSENNTVRNDMAASFNLTWLRNGTAAATANIPMGSFKLTGLGVATTSGDALSYGQAAVVSSLTNSALTSGRVPFASTGGLLADNAAFTFDGTTLSSTKFAGALNGTVGATTPSTGAFTTLSASSTVSGVGFSNYLASPPAIGGTAAAAGSFTTLSASSNVTLSGGTANGVAYLNGSKVLTTGSALTFDGSNLGLGVTPSAWLANRTSIAVKGSAVANFNYASAIGESTYNSYWNSSGTPTYQNNGYAAIYEFNNSATGGFAWKLAPSGTAGNAISFTQAMTLDSSGNWLLGKSTTAITTVGVCALANGRVMVTNAASTAADDGFQIYSTGASAYRFYVSMAGVVYATNTTISAISDQRYKENIRDLDVGLDAVMALKPRVFDWKAGKGKDIKNDRGFIAQEFEQVFPDLIDEWKDPAPEGEEPYKSVRQDLIPVLVKAIQEQQALIIDLQDRLTKAGL